MSSDESEKKEEVTVTDIRMPFGSMVLCMVKWAVASIPALIISNSSGLWAGQIPENELAYVGWLREPLDELLQNSAARAFPSPR